MQKQNMYSTTYIFDKSKEKSDPSLIIDSQFAEVGQMWAALFTNKHSSHYGAFVEASKQDSQFRVCLTVWLNCLKIED